MFHRKYTSLEEQSDRGCQSAIDNQHLKILVGPKLRQINVSDSEYQYFKIFEPFQKEFS